MSRRRLTSFAGALAALAALAVSLAAFAVASTTTLKLATAPSATLGKRVAVNPQGRTLYALSPETAHHLLCRAACLRFWPPLTVPSRATKLKLGGGLHGRLSLLKRSGGALQVTLNGRPLYRYSGDRGRGQVHGEGIVSFGGTWHAVAVAGTAPASPAPAPMPPPYTYPATGTTPAPAPTPAPMPTPTATETTPKPPPYPPYSR